MLLSDYNLDEGDMGIEWNRAYCGDNLANMEDMKDKGVTFNLILTDPPYNIGKDFGNDTDKQPLDDFLAGIDKRLSLMSSLLSPNGSIIWFCTHRYVGHIQFLLEKYFQRRRQMIWHYENGMSRQKREPVTEYDPFWWFSASDNFVYNCDDVRVPYKTDRVKTPVYKRDVAGNKKAWTADPRGRKRGDVWKYPTLAGKKFEAERTEHKTQKPMSLITDLIKAFCPKGMDGKYEGRILDPYLGSGTTGVCCEAMNKESKHRIKWVGIELEQKWVDVTNQRVQQQRDRCIEPDIFDVL